MSHPQVRSLVAPGVLLDDGNMRAWHGGLIARGAFQQLTIIIEDASSAPLGGKPNPDLSGIHRSAKVAITSHHADPMNLAYGVTGGSTPVILCRIGNYVLTGGAYTLSVEIPELAIRHHEEFTI